MKPAANSRLYGFFHSMTFQLLAYYCCISIVVMALGSYFINNYATNVIQKRSEEYIYEQFRQSEYGIQTMQSEVERLSRLFMIEDAVQEYLKSQDAKPSYETAMVEQGILSKINDFIDSSKNSVLSSIYIFSKNKTIGGSKTRSVVGHEENDHIFYKSGKYEKALASYPNPVWYTGLTDKYYYYVDDNKNPVNILSFALGVKPISQNNLASVIVFNINEADLCSTYSKLISTEDEVNYIIDSNGYIISSIRKDDIGKKGVFSPEKDVAFKSFTTTIGKARKMIVYYRIKETDWYIVREIPLELLQNDVISMQRIVILVFITSLVLIVFVSFFSMKRITDPLSGLAAKMKDMGKGNLGVTYPRIPKNELGLVIKRFNEMSVNIRDLVAKNTEAEREKKELEIEALQYQINPHFLYNTLNMIKWMAAVIKADNISDSVVALGNILRLLFSSNEPLCLVREEMSYLENYIKIMNLRFNNKIEFKFDIPGHLMDNKIIKFILQPVIENSVVHGSVRQYSHIDIMIHIEEAGDDLMIDIVDNGSGIPQEMLEAIRESLNMPFSQKEKMESIGLRNVNRRIRLNFGEPYGISIDSHEGEGTRVSIRLPKIR